MTLFGVNGISRYALPQQSVGTITLPIPQHGNELDLYNISSCIPFILFPHFSTQEMPLREHRLTQAWLPGEVLNPVIVTTQSLDSAGYQSKLSL